MSAVADEVHELAFNQGMRWLSDQATRLDTVRTRVSTLIAATGIVDGLLVTQVFSHHHGHPLTLPGDVALAVALIAVVLMSVALVRIWTVANEFNDDLDPRVLTDDFIDFALNFSDAAQNNQYTLTKLQTWFSAAAIAFLCGTAALGVALWDVLR